MLPNAELMNIRWKIAQYFELKWWKAYLGEKDKEVYLANKKKYWQQQYALISEDVPVNPSHTILDLGCGPSGIYLLFKENMVTAVDPLLDEYERHLGIFSRAAYPHTTFITSRIEDYQSKELFDIVFCMNAINHVADISQGYAKLASCTRKQGKIVVSIDAHNNAFFKFLFRLVPGDILHPHQYDLREYENFLIKNNCKVLQTELLKKGFFFNHYIMVAEKL